MIVPSPSAKESLERATETYHQQLMKDDGALEYLYSRKILKETAVYFRLGIVREPVSGDEAFMGRLSFPYITPTGIVTIRFRTLGDPGERSKFLVNPGEIQRPYNVSALRNAVKVFICEGETDTIAGHQSGLPCVGFPGAQSWNKETTRQFSRIFRNRKVSVLADNDDQGAGKDFADDIYRALGHATTIMMPSGMDVSKYVATHGEAALRELVGYEGS